MVNDLTQNLTINLVDADIYSFLFVSPNGSVPLELNPFVPKDVHLSTLSSTTAVGCRFPRTNIPFLNVRSLSNGLVHVVKWSDHRLLEDVYLGGKTYSTQVLTVPSLDQTMASNTRKLPFFFEPERPIDPIRSSGIGKDGRTRLSESPSPPPPNLNLPNRRIDLLIGENDPNSVLLPRNRENLPFQLLDPNAQPSTNRQKLIATYDENQLADEDNKNEEY